MTTLSDVRICALHGIGGVGDTSRGMKDVGVLSRVWFALRQLPNAWRPLMREAPIET